MDNKISVVINTYNASQYLREVLQSVKKFDEIVICDMESTDNTLDIAREYGCKIVSFERNKNSICEFARDFAIHSASNRWVFVVDADEIVPDELRMYLYDKISNPEYCEALAVGRLNPFMGEYIDKHPDYQLRFFRQDKTYWPPIIHSRPDVGAETAVVNIPAKKGLMLVHLYDPTFANRIEKMNNYTNYEVPKRRHRNYGAFKMLFRPVMFFLKNYILGGSFRYGKRGIICAYTSAMYQMMMMAKVTEDQIGRKQ